MLHLYRRHTKSCKKQNPQRGRSYWRCSCPIWVQGTLGGESVRRALDVTSREAALNVVSAWNVAGRIGADVRERMTITNAVAGFLADAKARHLAAATITKLTTIFERQLAGWAGDQGLVFLEQLVPERLAVWRQTWRDAPLSASKKHERVVGFFWFCVRMGWLRTNPMQSLRPPKVKPVPTLPFDQDEVARIVSACDEFPRKGVHGAGNRDRMRAFVLLLRYSGLRIRDAVTLRRDRIREEKLLLYTQKTGVPVFVPLPPHVVLALEDCPNPNPAYFFWSGNGLPKSAVADWQRSLRTLFALAGVTGGHAHRFRDTFAIALLLAGVPLDHVSILLGHSSVKITEKSYAPWVQARQEQLERAVQRTWSKARK